MRGLCKCHSTRDPKSFYATYAKITKRYLRENERSINQRYDPNQPIEVLTGQVKKEIDFSAAGKAAFMSNKVVNIACNLIFDTGMFNDD